MYLRKKPFNPASNQVYVETEGELGIIFSSAILYEKPFPFFLGGGVTYDRIRPLVNQNTTLVLLFLIAKGVTLIFTCRTLKIDIQ